jgi:hypothetical protein
MLFCLWHQRVLEDNSSVPGEDLKQGVKFSFEPSLISGQIDGSPEIAGDSPDTGKIFGRHIDCAYFFDAS